MNHITRVGAYGLLLDNGKILLCRLSKSELRNKGRWTLPGGGIEFAESPDKAVLREFLEETGMTVSISSIAGTDSINFELDGINYHHIRIIYWVGFVSGELTFEVNGSTDRCEWFELEQIKGMDRSKFTDLAISGIGLINNG